MYPFTQLRTENSLKQEPPTGGATLDFLLFLKANKETFEQILTFPFII
jgi:hypothetical protein